MFYIKVTEDNQIVGHPDIYDNLKYIFGEFDDSSIPDGWKKFEKISLTEVLENQVFISESYFIDTDGIVKDGRIEYLSNEAYKTLLQEKLNTIDKIITRMNKDQFKNQYIESWLNSEFDGNEKYAEYMTQQNQEKERITNLINTL
jgi:hypothetical protein